MYQFATECISLRHNVSVCDRMYQFATECISLRQKVSVCDRMYEAKAAEGNRVYAVAQYFAVWAVTEGEN